MKKMILFFAIMLFTTSLVFGVWHIDEGFEGGVIPGDWTIIDEDGGWGSWMAFNAVIPPHSGTWFAMPGENYDWDGHDWLVTPAVVVENGDSFSFWARAWNSTEDFNVKLSTTGTAISNFNVTLESVNNIGESWTEYSYDLSSYAGSTIYLAIEWLQDSYILCVDDVKVGQEDAPLPVHLSAFYALYIGGTPSIYWRTESETDNAYWNVYRGTSDSFEAAAMLNASSPVPGNGTTNLMSDYVYVDTAPVEENTTYWYWIEDVSLDGETEVHQPITLSIPSEETPVTPDYGLHKNYPNPFNPSTSISFTLQQDSDVELIIYNIKGEKIKSIFYDHISADQFVTTIWDGNDASGKQVSSGVYFYKLITDSKVYQKKMLMVK